MDSDFLTNGYSDKQELEKLEKKLIDLQSEMLHASEHDRGRHRTEIQKEIDVAEERIRALLEKLAQ